MKCPFRKITQTEIIYGRTDVPNPKPIKIEKKEYFAECDGATCVAWDCGVCMKLEE